MQYTDRVRDLRREEGEAFNREHHTGSSRWRCFGIKCDHNDQSFEYQYEACEETSVPIPDLVESVTEKQYFRVVFGIELILQKSGKFGCIGDCVDHLSIEISVLSPK